MMFLPFLFYPLGGNHISVRLKTDLVPVEGLYPCSDLSFQKVIPKYISVCLQKCTYASRE